MNGLLDGRLILVTGAASGIGKCTVAACRAAGARVVAADLQPVGAITAAAGLGADDLALSLDVADATAVRAALEAVQARYGHLDGLVNCAGINGQGTIDQVKLEQFRKVLAVHVEGTFNLTQAALPLLRAGSRPAIVVPVQQLDHLLEMRFSAGTFFLLVGHGCFRRRVLAEYAATF